MKRVPIDTDFFKRFNSAGSRAHTDELISSKKEVVTSIALLLNKSLRLLKKEKYSLSFAHNIIRFIFRPKASDLLDRFTEEFC